MVINSHFNWDDSYTRRLPRVFYTKAYPEKVASAQIIMVNYSLAADMGVNLATSTQTQLAELFTGQVKSQLIQPFSQAYAGHQFGHWAILGDGRAHLLGEHICADGRRLDVQLKGSGRTAYARGGDGKAALGPMLREYIISEALHHLGVPTTRSLAVVATGETIIRQKPLRGAILTRVASSHIRFGTIQYAAMQNDSACLQALVQYAIERHYPSLKDHPHQALALLEAVMEKTVDLIVHWMRVGFIHGVMNTDNMTLSGESLDFGPCAFMDVYDPDTVFSAIDQDGRYAYGQQAYIAQWNLARLAEALLPAIHVDSQKAVIAAGAVIARFPGLYQQRWLRMMCAKLGLFESLPGDQVLVQDLLDWMQHNKADYTITFRELSVMEKSKYSRDQDKVFQSWVSRWHERLSQQHQPVTAAVALMKRNNPAIIPRNHQVEAALQAAEQKNEQPLRDLLCAMAHVYDDVSMLGAYYDPPSVDNGGYQTFCGT